MRSAIKKSGGYPASVRFGQRVPLDVHVRLRVGSRVEGRGIIRNASISGAFIATALELPLYTELAVTLPGRGGTTHVFDARVVRVDGIGLGVEWRGMAGTDVVDLLERPC